MQWLQLINPKVLKLIIVYAIFCHSIQGFALPLEANLEANPTTTVTSTNSQNNGAVNSTVVAPFKIELPPLTTTQVTTGSATDAIGSMMVSFPIYTPASGLKVINKHLISKGDEKKGFIVYTYPDPVKFETSLGVSFIKGLGFFSDLKNADGTVVSSNQKVLILPRYGFENDLAVKMMSDAKKQGLFGALLLTDSGNALNESTIVFEEGKKTSNHIGPENLSVEGKQGKALKKLLDEGYVLSSPKFNPLKNPDNLEAKVLNQGEFKIAMNAAGNPDDAARDPLMHEKAMLMVVLKNPNLIPAITPENISHIFVTDGTNNLTTTPHFNRLKFYSETLNNGETKIHEQGWVALQHSLKMANHFMNENSSAAMSDMPSIGLQRFLYPDGTIWEVGYTDGKYELNQRLSLRYYEMINDPKIRIDKVIRSHFVQTNKNQIDAEEQLFNAQSKLGNDFKILGVVDEQFVGKDNWGVTAQQAGYQGKTPFGLIRDPRSKAYSDAVDLKVYFEEVKDANGNYLTGIEPGGIPKHRRLWHDKLTMVEWFNTDNPNEKWVDIYVGSYNNSNNKFSAERQDYLRVKADSAFYIALRESVLQNGEMSLRQGYSAPLKEAVFIKEFAAFVGQMPNDIRTDDPDAKESYDGKSWKKVLAIKRIIESIHTLKSDEEREVKLKSMASEIHKMVDGISSRLIKPLQVTPEQLDKNLKTLFKFYRFYFNLPPIKQGKDMKITADEMLALANSLLKDAKTAKFALMDIYDRPFIPKTILETRAYLAFKQMGLKEMYLESGKTAEQSEFRFNFNPLFNITNLDIRKSILWRNQLIQKNISTLAKEIYEWSRVVVQKDTDANGIYHHTFDVLPVLTTTEEISVRLNKLLEIVDYFESVQPIKATDKFQEKYISRERIIDSLFLENMNVILEKGTDHVNLKYLMYYLLSLKGFKISDSATNDHLKKMMTIVGVDFDKVTEMEKNPKLRPDPKDLIRFAKPESVSKSESAAICLRPYLKKN